MQPIRGAVPEQDADALARGVPGPRRPQPAGDSPEPPGDERPPQLRTMLVAAAMGLLLAGAGVFVACGVQANPTVQVPNLPGVPTLPTAFPSLPGFPTLPPGFSLPPGFPQLPTLPG